MDILQSLEKNPSQWVQCNEVRRTIDIIRQIRVPIDTCITIVCNKIPILEQRLSKEIPFTMNLPVLFAPYGSIEFLFEPPTSFEQTALYLDDVSRAILYSADSLEIPRHQWQCKEGAISLTPIILE